MYSGREQERRADYDRDFNNYQGSGREGGSQYGGSQGGERYDRERYDRERGRRNDDWNNWSYSGSQGRDQRNWGGGSSAGNYSGYRSDADRPNYSPNWPDRRQDQDYTTIGSSSGLGNRGESLFGTTDRGNYRGSDLSSGALGSYTVPSSGVSHAGKGPKGYRRSDERIQEDVSEALSQHHELDASEIEVKVNNGEVILSGSVTERQFKRMAEDIAERCPGVRDVRNDIRVQRYNGGDPAATTANGQDQQQQGRNTKFTAAPASGKTS